MRTSRRNTFEAINTEGALLPASLLLALAERKAGLQGVSEESYHLSGIKLTEAIGQSWNRLIGSFRAYRTAVSKLPESDPATSATREKWLLPLFEELRYGRLPTVKAEEIGGKQYSISHRWSNVPIHLVGCRVDLDRRSRATGAWRGSPHGLMQEYLNRNEDSLWGFVSNGLKLRILRDNITLTRQAYVEFDLEAIFAGEVYSDFAILWLLCHQSRVEAERPEQFWLEKWSREAQKTGTRALEKLRLGVEDAINSLGSGFISHQKNNELRAKLHEGKLDKQEYYRQLLRIVYRLIFLFVAEDRDLLIPKSVPLKMRRRYYDYYSVSHIRTLAEKRAGSQHADLWKVLYLVFSKLGAREGCPHLGVPPLGSFLWSDAAISDLYNCELANSNLLRAIYSLSFTAEGGVRMPVDYRNLGAEELGSVYEALLEMHPQLDLSSGSFSLATAAGNERKTTGSYYTPTCLVNCLLDSALEPVIAEAMKKPDPEKAILELKVCDPACGSGHFSINAAHRIAKRLASVRTGDEEPSPEALKKAVRDVISHCIYGVDLNPMAVELCKISLWMEALEPGKPLSFLDHHIRVGNSLLGTTPELISAGLPDDAFTAIEGDDKKICAALKKRNKHEREKKLQDMFHMMIAEPKAEYNSITAKTRGIDEAPDDTIDQIQRKAEQFHRLPSRPGRCRPDPSQTRTCAIDASGSSGGDFAKRSPVCPIESRLLYIKSLFILAISFAFLYISSGA